MRPPDLKPAAELAANKPHGHKMRYLAGCRCWRCRRGNAAYERMLEENRKKYGPNDLVPVDRARAFLKDMQKLGIGYQTIAKHIGAAKTCMGEILWPGISGRRQLRRRTEAKILSYRPTLDTLPGSLEVPSAATLARVHQLIAWGYPKSIIALDGMKTKIGALQIARINPRRVEVDTAKAIRDFFNRVVHARKLWEKRHGRIPARHYVYWKQRRLVLIPFAVSYDYHYRYPSALKEAIKLKNKLKRAVRAKRKRTRNGKEQH